MTALDRGCVVSIVWQFRPDECELWLYANFQQNFRLLILQAFSSRWHCVEESLWLWVVAWVTRNGPCFTPHIVYCRRCQNPQTMNNFAYCFFFFLFAPSQGHTQCRQKAASIPRIDQEKTLKASMIQDIVQVTQMKSAGFLEWVLLVLKKQHRVYENRMGG